MKSSEYEKYVTQIVGLFDFCKHAKIKAEYNQLHEMATASGGRVLGTALVVISDSTGFRGEGRSGLVSDHC
jgi:hypothetical protein